MRTVLMLVTAIVLMTLTAPKASAQMCQGEAQVIGWVEKANFDRKLGCFISIGDVRMLSPNNFCPMQAGDILHRPIKLRVSRKRDCVKYDQAEISGIVISTGETLEFD